MKQNVLRFQQMHKKLQTFGYKLTPQRIAIVKILSERTDHPKPEDIYEELQKDFPTTSTATVYKTLAILKELKEVLEIQYSHESNRYDGFNPQPHPHIYCNQCKEISDLYFNGFSDLQDIITTQTGYQIEQFKLDVTGVCPECQKNRTSVNELKTQFKEGTRKCLKKV
ncbi:Fur family transcriptional regulator [Candidatus Magnetomorum sp. HK-1]|nr:Fur family transcriptional regulator [Candidatus Magnetomorum sp. HK-1]